MASYRYLFLALPLLLGACDNVRDTLGLTRNGPDEFAVATTPPLVMPPDFTLRPPAPGSEGAQGVAASEQARAALLGNDAKATTATTTSGGEAALLQQAGTTTPKLATTGGDKTAAMSPQAKTLDTVLFGTPSAPAGSSAPTITMSHDDGGWFDWL